MLSTGKYHENYVHSITFHLHYHLRNCCSSKKELHFIIKCVPSGPNIDL